jgi:hypothetical protein
MQETTDVSWSKVPTHHVGEPLSRASISPHFGPLFLYLHTAIRSHYGRARSPSFPGTIQKAI